MNIQQLEYIIALDTHRHFVKAAETCFVTQATLSTMVKKLEEELGVKIFDRSKLPIIPTETSQKYPARESSTSRDRSRAKRESNRGAAHWYHTHPCTLFIALVFKFIFKKISRAQIKNK